MALKQCEIVSSEPSQSSASTSRAEPARPRSLAQQAASRANAKRSTGPRTKAGKLRSRRNSWKHGCYANEFTGLVRRSYKDSAVEEPVTLILRKLRADFRRQYRPCAPEEALIVDRLTAVWYRLMRLHMCSNLPIRDLKPRDIITYEAIMEAESLSPKEARLESSIARLRKGLAFLQRMRLGRNPVWGIQDFEPVEEDVAESSENETADLVAEAEVEASEPSADEASQEPPADDSTPEVHDFNGEAKTSAENTDTNSEGYDETEGTKPSRDPGA